MQKQPLIGSARPRRRLLRAKLGLAARHLRKLILIRTTVAGTIGGSKGELKILVNSLCFWSLASRARATLLLVSKPRQNSIQSKSALQELAACSFNSTNNGPFIQMRKTFWSSQSSDSSQRERSKVHRTLATTRRISCSARLLSLSDCRDIGHV
jgi:hypothetical protein